MQEERDAKSRSLGESCILPITVVRSRVEYTVPRYLVAVFLVPCAKVRAARRDLHLDLDQYERYHSLSNTDPPHYGAGPPEPIDTRDEQRTFRLPGERRSYEDLARVIPEREYEFRNRLGTQVTASLLVVDRADASTAASHRILACVTQTERARGGHALGDSLWSTPTSRATKSNRPDESPQHSRVYRAKQILPERAKQVMDARLGSFRVTREWKKPLTTRLVHATMVVGRIRY